MLRYLKTTAHFKMNFSINPKKILECYADADWAGEIPGRKSTSGCLIIFGGNPIYWHCKKQTCVASSTTEAEFISAAIASKELVWIIRMLEDCAIEIKKTSLFI